MRATLHHIAIAGLVALIAGTAVAQSIKFGDDSNQWANDGECDDPRFVGEGMAASLAAESVLTDASDCAMLFDAGMIRMVRTRAEADVSECRSISFGDDSSEWSNDNECDDPRFTGPGIHSIMNAEDLMGDATDCRALCESGDVWLR
ncbi:hypothetical protein [Pontivivens ytuae]|uniref:Uncharacterized protein n=1 Tax=Pontivivens ytuae TaxID=2789856 RepID=A0A7S9QBZ6_9RHOB|nr:hypothetical protein [Pontivivens ytuae]QPH52551.1 hypothetical protein I0K15_12055 [Pontivivens ytuae]